MRAYLVTKPFYRPIAFCIAIYFVFFSYGCSSASLGIRPDRPNSTLEDKEHEKLCGGKDVTKADCTLYYRTVEYGQNLSEAYRSRATINSWAVYLAGAIALGALAASAGLAATSNGSSDAAKLIPIGAGFGAGVAALSNNSEKARAYTEAANQLDKAVCLSKISYSGGSPNFLQRHDQLLSDITKIRNELEDKRVEGLPTEKKVDEIAKTVDAIKEALKRAKQDERPADPATSGNAKPDQPKSVDSRQNGNGSTEAQDKSKPPSGETAQGSPSKDKRPANPISSECQ